MKQLKKYKTYIKEDYTHIHILLDRTGSMEIIRDDTIGGFNTFLKEQKTLPGKATLSLIQFDSRDPYEKIYDFKPITEVPELTKETYIPRATTPLLDALGRTINDVESQIKAINSEERPERVVVVVITDGQENASREFKKDQIEKMIKEKQNNDKWQFVFLSADLNSIDDAFAIGFVPQSTMTFDANEKGVTNMYISVSNSVANYRAGATTVTFSDEDRKKQTNETTE